MGYIKFSSEKADYVFNGINHIGTFREKSLFRGIDGLVVEGNRKFVGHLHPHKVFPSAFGNRDLVQICKDEQIPVFSVDFFVDAYRSLGEEWRKYFLDILLPRFQFPKDLFLPLSAFMLPVEFFYSTYKGKIPNLMQKYAKFIHGLEKLIIDGRNVIAAEKIEEYLVQLVQELNGGRRPKIGIIYGMGHLGLIDYILSKEKRREKIKRLQKDGSFNSFDKKDLFSIRKFVYNDTIGWYLIYIYLSNFLDGCE